MAFKWCSGVILEWNIITTVQMVRHCQSWMSSMCGIGERITLRPHDWYNGVNPWLKYHNHCTYRTAVSIVNVNNVWDWWKSYITIVHMVPWCQSWMSSMCAIGEKMTLLSYKLCDVVNLEWNIIDIVQNGTTVPIVSVNYLWAWLKNGITIVQIVKWCQSRNKYHYYWANGTTLSIVNVNGVWDLRKNDITIVQTVQWCQFLIKYH